MEMFAQTDDVLLSDWVDSSLDPVAEALPAPAPVFTKVSVPGEFDFTGTDSEIYQSSLFQP